MSNARNLARVIVDSSGDIAANNLDNAVPADGSITAAKLAASLDLSNKTLTYPDNSVAAAKLAASLDLSSKTLTYPDNSVQSADIASLAASKLSGQVPDANAPVGSVINVVTYTKTNALLCSAPSNTWSEPDTNFRIQFTPLSASSKFLLFMHISGGSQTGCPRMRFEYSTNGGSSWSLCSPIGDARGSRTQSHCSIAINGDGNVMSGTSAEILFAPATTSTIRVRVLFGADQPNYLAWNHSRNDNNTFLGNTMTSTLRAMEIKG